MAAKEGDLKGRRTLNGGNRLVRIFLIVWAGVIADARVRIEVTGINSLLRRGGLEQVVLARG